MRREDRRRRDRRREGKVKGSSGKEVCEQFEWRELDCTSYRDRVGKGKDEEEK